MWEWREQGPGPVRWGFTGTAGGRPEGRRGGFNLGDHVGDDPEVVAAHRAALAGELGVAPDRLIFLTQVHAADVAHVDGPQKGPIVADAAVTTRPGLALAVMVADCVPVLFADEAGIAIGVAHAGRAGLLAGAVGATVAALRGLGATRLRALVGPSVCGSCYEVPEEMRAAAIEVVPESAATTRRGTPALDLAAGVLAQLDRLDVPHARVPGCTFEDPRWFSHRRHAPTGRFAGVVVKEA